MKHKDEEKTRNGDDLIVPPAVRSSGIRFVGNLSAKGRRVEKMTRGWDIYLYTFHNLR